MSNKVFSGINELPRGEAKRHSIEGCMCLEGGAFRGVYTSGVLDFLMEKGINLTTTIGVSAGALNGMNYVAGQIGRSALCNLKYRHDHRWVGVSNLKSSKGVIGFNFLQEGLEEEYPFDSERFKSKEHRLIAVATNIQTGQPEYFDSSQMTIKKTYKAVAASASLPFMSKPVTLGKQYYLDGGCATKLPVRWALDKGFEKIVFIATRETEYRRKEHDKPNELLNVLYKDFPEFRKSFTETNTVYNNDCDMIDELVSKGRIFRIAPSSKVLVSRLEGDMEKLGELYYRGYEDAKNAYDDLIDYLFK